MKLHIHGPSVNGQAGQGSDDEGMGSQQRLSSIERELRDAVATLRREHDEYAAMHDSANEAALTALEKRLDGMNEFRKAVNDLSNRQLTRLEHEAAVGMLTARLDRSADVLGELGRTEVAVSSDVRDQQVRLAENTKKIEKLEESVIAQLPREMYEQNQAALSNRVSALERWKATVGGRTAVIGALAILTSTFVGAVLERIVFKN